MSAVFFLTHLSFKDKTQLLVVSQASLHHTKLKWWKNKKKESREVKAITIIKRWDWKGTGEQLDRQHGPSLWDSLGKPAVKEGRAFNKRCLHHAETVPWCHGSYCRHEICGGGEEADVLLGCTKGIAFGILRETAIEFKLFFSHATFREGVAVGWTGRLGLTYTHYCI